ncbi:hypothetical protein [Maribacter sp. 2307ULW6-5]|uniref:hypothetical protein n=1 Tax=Maribacter sp. 2307ULW6-5 TaxID=3386275 RepID=UPI0039BD6DE1
MEHMHTLKKTSAILVLFAFSLVVGCDDRPVKTEPRETLVPSLDDLSAIWMAADTMAIEPSIRNFRGQALLNRDMTSLSWFVSAPFSGGHHTGTLKINGRVPKASHFRWYPYQALRKGSHQGLEIASATRMLVEEDAIMWEIEMTNSKDTVLQAQLDLDMIGYISQYKKGDWKWWYPFPDWNGERSEGRDQAIENMRANIGKDKVHDTVNWPTDAQVLRSAHYEASGDRETIYVKDRNTPAITAFSIADEPDSISVFGAGATAKWNLELQPGESKMIRYFLAYGDEMETLKANVANWNQNFDPTFTSVKEKWAHKWSQLFTPGNTMVSGSFPVLETEDKNIEKVYYTGPLTMLYLLNTNLPEHERVYLTGGPRWGASTTFFWDIAIWSELWAVVDPKMMREHIVSWIQIDPNTHYGKDNFGGNGVGNAYSANYWCLFKIIRAYLTHSGDYAFLDETIGQKTVLEHLHSYALNWENLSKFGEPGHGDERYKLADFGPDPWNLLECVPTYIHIVPSFNIGYVWMMRETAKLYRRKGNEKEASVLETQAEEMVSRILGLYAGEGIWNSLYPNNETVEVRHVLDFIYFGKFLANDVDANVKQEMMDFLNTELRTDLWMRAQSLKDIAAKDSDRPDHGPLGSFDGWIPEAMESMINMGYAQEALDFYTDIAPVTQEGVWAQARELWGEDKYKKTARVRIASRGWNNRESSSGIGISQVMLKSFFGFYPQIDGQAIQDLGDFPFAGKGKMHHVFYEGAYYTIYFQGDKPVMKRERLENGG